LQVSRSFFICIVPRLKEIQDALLHLFFPHTCSGCGTDILPADSLLCLRCMASLPETGFEWHPGNPVEKIFHGRLPLAGASAQFYFTKESLVQHLMHQLKYRGSRDLGLQLGRLMGAQLLRSGRFGADALVPLPLFPARERKRGYNQATVLCKGIAEVLRIPVLEKLVTRPQYTETQTQKGRIERWKNMEGKFVARDLSQADGKHLLLVDDVITTGATLEACGNEILKGRNITLSVGCLCIAARS
jgi:ComF family protein